MTSGQRLSPVTVAFAVLLGLCAPGTAAAQPSQGDTKVWIYPILVWVPSFKATPTVPPFPDTPDGPDLPGGSGTTATSFDGAALAGFSIEKARWRVDADGIWAALVTERERPLLEVDLDVIYGHVSGGVKIVKDLYVTAGVRRLALKYDIELADRAQHFVRKPGIWDPLVGIGWHSDLGSRWTLHATGEGGGFGVGSDLELAGSVRADVKLGGHVGLTFGYNVLYLKLCDTVAPADVRGEADAPGPRRGAGILLLSGTRRASIKPLRILRRPAPCRGSSA